MNDWFEEKDIDNISLKELEDLCGNYADLRELKDEKKAELKEIENNLLRAQEEILSVFEKFGKQKYDSSSGLISTSERLSVRMPQGQDKEDFFNYLKEQNLFEDMATIHSRTLTSFYKAEMEASTNPVDFKMPGITEVTLTPTISFRRKK